MLQVSYGRHFYRLLRSLQATRCFSHGTNKNGRSYETSIKDLNSLQSNAATINALRAAGTMNQNAIAEMRSWISKAGVSEAEINDLKVIHVAGTKGKGSTSAMVASILANYKLAYGRTPKIGLYTSPHLKSVRERIQIDGEPIPKEEWTEYFYNVWDNLNRTGTKKPVYFRFLTILAFHSFIQECVDVVVLECGVGGEYDSTNVVKSPVAAGVTSLGIDHVQILGKTIEEIAWHKGGIFKSGCPAFSVEQPTGALAVLRARAQELSAETLQIVPVHKALSSVRLGLNGDFQKSNASLAIALANAYLKTQGVDENLSERLPSEFIQGLEEVKWPGRCERRQVGNVEWCLDGAHTSESLQMTGEWYRSILDQVQEQHLVFNQQTRDSAALLEQLYKSLDNCTFRSVIFCTNKTFKDSGYAAELTSINNAQESVESRQVQLTLAEKWLSLTGQSAIVHGSIQEAVDTIVSQSQGKPARCLITGSLHLVGGAMTVLDAAGSAG